MKDTNLAELDPNDSTNTHAQIIHPVAHSVSSPNDRHAYWPTCAMRSTKAEKCRVDAPVNGRAR